MNNIFNIKDCYGCGMCSVVCKHDVIDLQLNEEGFFQPTIINSKNCVNCGLCTKVCSFINEHKKVQPRHSYAAWSKDPETRKTSTSGGVSFEIARYLLSQGYKFCGVKYNTELERAEHYIATTIKELEQSKGSKYLQSFTKKSFLRIDRKQNYLIVGSPCQIASFRKYVELFRCSEHFILMDFFCHGVPSYLLWKKYLEENTQELGKIKNASWRNKIKGWHKSYCITLEGEKKTFQSWNGKDNFYTMFLGDACLGKACFDSCKFKYNNSAADIRIGDFWGNTYKSNNEGVCSAIAFTEKGTELLNMANLELHEYPFKTVAAGQMEHNPKRPWFYKKCMKSIKSENTRLANIVKTVRMYKSFCGHINRLKQILHL